MMLSTNELQDRYQQIVDVYHTSEELLNTVDSPFVHDAETQLNIIEPLVSAVSESTDELTELFLDAAKDQDKRNPISRKRCETALRKIYIALEAYSDRVRLAKAKSVVTLHNIANPIVNRLKRQIECVVAIFMELLSISPQLIMSHHEVERLKQREGYIALMMHQAAQGHS